MTANQTEQITRQYTIKSVNEKQVTVSVESSWSLGGKPVIKINHNITFDIAAINKIFDENPDDSPVNPEISSEITEVNVLDPNIYNKLYHDLISEDGFASL